MLSKRGVTKFMLAPRIRFNALILLLAALVATTACGLNAVSRGKVAPSATAPAGSLSADDRAKIHAYFAKQPAVGAKDSARGLARGDRIGGGRLIPLPGALESRLRPLGAGYRRARVGYDVLLVDSQNTIVDMAYDAAR